MQKYPIIQSILSKNRITTSLSDITKYSPQPIIYHTWNVRVLTLYLVRLGQDTNTVIACCWTNIYLYDVVLLIQHRLLKESLKKIKRKRYLRPIDKTVVQTKLPRRHAFSQTQTLLWLYPNVHPTQMKSNVKELTINCRLHRSFVSQTSTTIGVPK